MRLPRRHAPTAARRLALVALVAAIAGGTAACDATPTAATVDGQSIHQSTLDAELRQLSSNTAFIKAEDAASAQYGASVEGAGRNTYDAQWTAHVLSGIVVADAVHAYLAAHHRLPGAELYADASAVEPAAYSPYWLGFPTGYRQQLVQRTADLAALEPPTAPAGQISTAYSRNLGYLYSQVCVLRVSVAAASQATAFQEAEGLATSLSSTPGGPAASHAGTTTCYTPAGLATQSQAVVTAVESTDPGKVARPIPTSYGYDVIAVTSRKQLPLDDSLRRVLSVAIGSARPSPALERVLGAADVRLDPAYGTWARTNGSWAVNPPTGPRAVSS